MFLVEKKAVYKGMIITPKTIVIVYRDKETEIALHGKSNFSYTKNAIELKSMNMRNNHQHI